MAGRRDSWLEVFRALGQAFLEVLSAELAVLAEHWKRSGREFGIGLLLFAIAAVLLVGILPGLLVFALVALLQTWLSWPAAAFVVALIVALTGYLLVRWGLYVWQRRLELPWVSAQQRLDDHLDWWHESILGQERPSALKQGESHDSADEGDRGGHGTTGEPPPTG